MRVVKKILSAVVVAALMVGMTPQPAHAAIGCDDHQDIMVLDRSHAGIYGEGHFTPASDGSGDGWSGGINSGVFVGEATRTGSNLGYDTFSYVAHDIVSGAEITGTYRVSTAKCLGMAAANGAASMLGLDQRVPVVASHTTVDSYKQK